MIEEVPALEQVIYRSLTTGLIANEVLLPLEIRAAVREHIVVAVREWLLQVAAGYPQDE